MSLERIIVNSMKQSARDRQRVERERKREYNRQCKEQAKYEKMMYIESKYEEANAKTEELMKSYDRYNLIIKNIQTCKIFDFEALKEKYYPKEYKSRYSKPLKSTSENKIEVPKKHWIENILPSVKAKRITIENEKDRLKEENEEKYKKDSKRYEENIIKEKIEWETKEKIKREKIEKQNKEIDIWKNDCINLKEEAIKKFINNILKKNNLLNEVTLGNVISFNKEIKKVIIDIQMELKDNIFKYEGYKYIKQRDIIEPVSMKIGLQNQKMKDLIINLCIAIFILMFKNDSVNAFDEIIVNIYHNRICCVSGKLNKITYNDLKFDKEEDIIYIQNHFLRIYKQISTGVKPIEETYLKLF